ncbi:hypothetical protein RRG08_053269 [Elysia crispata]|uniref:Uncharacterized protein n=1 Tax=Elysia crispata TaxID=231223 RepID=A0AAE1API3_9GAST|nr:hypothetical protein RRG08_053269 [Elysia crispata]
MAIRDGSLNWALALKSTWMIAKRGQEKVILNNQKGSMKTEEVKEEEVKEKSLPSDDVFAFAVQFSADWCGVMPH